VKDARYAFDDGDGVDDDADGDWRECFHCVGGDDRDMSEVRETKRQMRKMKGFCEVKGEDDEERLVHQK